MSHYPTSKLGNKIISQQLAAQWEARLARTQLVLKNSGFYFKTGSSTLNMRFFKFPNARKTIRFHGIEFLALSSI